MKRQGPTTIVTTTTIPAAQEPKPISHEAKRINSSAVRGLCGEVTDMTLWRWIESPDLCFPKPTYIGRRRFWKEVDIVAWLDSRDSLRS